MFAHPGTLYVPGHAVRTEVGSGEDGAGPREHGGVVILVERREMAEQQLAHVGLFRYPGCALG